MISPAQISSALPVPGIPYIFPQAVAVAPGDSAGVSDPLAPPTVLLPETNRPKSQIVVPFSTPQQLAETMSVATRTGHTTLPSASTPWAMVQETEDQTLQGLAAEVETVASPKAEASIGGLDKLPSGVLEIVEKPSLADD